MSTDSANPQTGSENASGEINIEAAFDDYLKRQANPADAEVEGEQRATKADPGQFESDAKPATAEADAPEEQRFKVKVNGEELEIPLSELVKGYQLESDYRIKTSQAAEQSRAAQAQYQQAQQMQAQYQQALQTYASQLQAIQPQPPDPAMIEADPVGYLRQQQAFQNWQQQMMRVQNEQQQLDEQQRQQKEVFSRDMLAKEAELLSKAIPDWSDAEKAKAEKAALSKYLKDVVGFDESQVSSISDHRAVVMARKAMLYDQLMAKQSSVTEKVSKLPPKTPQRPGGGEISPTDGRTRAMQSLKKSGSIDDAANAFAAMLAR